MSNFDQAFSAAQRAYDNMTPDCGDMADEAAQAYVEPIARDLAEGLVLHNREVPGLPELTFSELTAEWAYVNKSDCPESLWSRDREGNPYTSWGGRVRVDISDVMVAYARRGAMDWASYTNGLSRGAAPVDATFLRWIMIEAAEQYIMNQANSVYMAHCESMEPDYD